MKVLGISASLRNARYGAGSESFITELKACADKDAVKKYLHEQTQIRVFEFMDAGREKAESFDVIYRNLRKQRNARGLSNSETALGAGLWGCYNDGVDIEHVGLARYFPMRGEAQNLDKLKEIVLSADGYLISGPVYFGDRGSVAQEFISWLKNDPEIVAHLQNKAYAGLAVGAKRNGGQETTLMFQIFDMCQLGMHVVGNDAETTSQYGGTIVAGDIGTAGDDNYGLDTSIGTGRRIAKVVNLHKISQKVKLRDRPRISIWAIQDDENRSGRAHIEKWCEDVSKRIDVDFQYMDISAETVHRCIACDLCPTHVGPLEEYRCIINDKEDFFKANHEKIVDTDGILLAAYSPKDWQNLNSVYQRFIERTRYFRRDDYVFSNYVAAPIVISEIGSQQYISMRMAMSLLRHNTILTKPLIGRMNDGEILNWDALVNQGEKFVQSVASMTPARLEDAVVDNVERRYNPVGYAISLARVNEEVEVGLVDKVKSDAGVAANESVKARVVSK
ncbi:NAD(P)H-dependent oxidoreductase [Hellea sp.]|nr:NAD(P)H-dependent oxidoreductase [Hellea sp.]